MDHLIEPAKSGRASCRKCREKIEKGELRFGHAVDSEFSSDPTYQWYHLKCAAEKVPGPFAQALPETEHEIPDREALEAVCKDSKKKVKPTEFPYAERAPSARSSCILCSEKIEKGAFRIAIEREIDTGSFKRMGAGYLHPKCASTFEETEDLDALYEVLQETSTSLEADELEALADELA